MPLPDPFSRLSTSLPLFRCPPSASRGIINNQCLPYRGRDSPEEPDPLSRGARRPFPSANARHGGPRPSSGPCLICSDSPYFTKEFVNPSQCCQTVYATRDSLDLRLLFLNRRGTSGGVQHTLTQPRAPTVTNQRYSMRRVILFLTWKRPDIFPLSSTHQQSPPVDATDPGPGRGQPTLIPFESGTRSLGTDRRPLQTARSCPSLLVHMGSDPLIKDD